MSTSPFRFKQFSVAHDQSTHKVGTDGVLLGAWVTVTGKEKNILDAGTGTGLIGLMLAQRSGSQAHIDAVEISEPDARQAAQNVLHSPWPGKVSVHHTALQQFFPKIRYDLIVSNPPFFINSWLPPGVARGRARHTAELSQEALLDAVCRLLTPEGKLAVVLPVTEGSRFTEHATAAGLHPVRRLQFRSRAHKPVERLLCEFSREASQIKEESLVLYGAGESWSEAYRQLTGAFYLKT